MSFLQKFRIPFTDDKSFGFLFLATLMIPLATMPPLPDPLETVKFCLWLACAGLSLIFFVKDRNGGKSVFSTVALIGLISLFAWSIISTIWSPDVVNSLFGATIRLTNSVIFFGLWLIWLVLLSYQSREKFEFLLKALITSGGIVALWGIIQSLGIGYYAGLTVEVRNLYPSFLGNPNYSAMFLVPIILLSPWAIVSAKSKFSRWWYIAVLVMSVWGIIIFTSRGALLGLALPLGLFLLISALRRKWKVIGYSLLVGGIGLLIAVGYLAAIRPTDTANIADPVDQSAIERFAIWSEAEDLIIQHPIVGSGPGNFFLLSRQYNNSVLPGPTWFDDVHNLILHVAVTVGLPGLLALLIVIGAACWNYYRFFRSKAEDYLLPTLLLCALLGWLIASSFNPVTLPNWLIFGTIIVGLFQIHPQSNRMAGWFKIPWVKYPIAAVFLIVALSFISSDILVWQADLYTDSHPNLSRNLLKASITANPTDVTSLFELIKSLVVHKDFASAQHYIDYLHKLHPHSAGVNQKIYYAHLLTYEATHDDSDKAKFYEAGKQYELSNPYNTKTIQDLAYAYMTIGDLPTAEQYAKKYVVLSGGDPFSWILLTKIYIGENDYKHAIFAFDKSYRLKPNQQMRYYLEDAKKNKTEGKDIILPIYFPPITY